MKIKVPGSGMTVFNRYKLERILGRGGMGVVWLADDLKLERPVALKFLPSLIGLDPAAVKELKTETRRGLELSHPNIVRIYDFVDDEDAAAISMEFVDGKTLSELRIATSHGVFSVEDLSRWLPGVCDALDYAHFQRKLVHRDLKPANIMLTTKEEVAKVADFGIARSLSDTMSRLSVAAVGTSGTLPYMSPQQAMGERPLPTDDVYSLGATIYELLAGKPPFYRGDLPTQINSKIAPSMTERRLELEITGAPPIPQAWEDAIAACLNKDPNMRPSCAGVLAEMLGLKTSTVTARTLHSFSASINNQRGTQKKPNLLPRIAAAITIAGVAGIGGWYFSNHKNSAPSVSQAAPSPVIDTDDEAPLALGPKTSLIADVPSPAPTANGSAKPTAMGPNPNSPAPVPVPTAPATTMPQGNALATAAAVSGTGSVPAVPVTQRPDTTTQVASPSSPVSVAMVNPVPGQAITPAAGGGVTGNNIPPANLITPAGGTMPLMPDASATIAAYAPPQIQSPPSNTLPVDPNASAVPGVPAGMAPATGGSQMVMVPAGPMQPDGSFLPPIAIPMPPQPVAEEPSEGYWPVDQIYPSMPYASYSFTGKRYLLYRTQIVLKQRGLYNSKVDGKEGKSTHHAIQLFQAKSGLRPTGLLDLPTLAALQLSAENDQQDWVPPLDTPSPRRNPTGGARYGKQTEEEPGFLERTGGKIKNLFK